MIPYPHINPIAIQLGPLAIHWYGILYMVAFVGCYCLLRVKKILSLTQLDDLIFYAALGVILGGRLGYVLFYGWSFLKTDWLFIFKIWQGGMSFHGGLLGVILALYYFAKKNRQSFWAVGDLIAPVVPFGLMCGRLGNFINAELWGRVTDVPWAMVTPGAGPLPRHPSALYELLLEGLFLLILLHVCAKKLARVGQLSGLFLLGYGVCRIFVEQFRTPDPQIGFLWGEYLTLGQLLSVPMILLGLYLLMRKPLRGNT